LGPFTNGKLTNDKSIVICAIDLALNNITGSDERVEVVLVRIRHETHAKTSKV
jgi:hypothetical protein